MCSEKNLANLPSGTIIVWYQRRGKIHFFPPPSKDNPINGGGPTFAANNKKECAAIIDVIEKINHRAGREIHISFSWVCKIYGLEATVWTLFDGPRS